MAKHYNEVDKDKTLKFTLGTFHAFVAGLASSTKEAIQSHLAPLKADINDLRTMVEAGGHSDRECNRLLRVLDDLAFKIENAPLTAVRESPVEHENPIVSKILAEGN